MSYLHHCLYLYKKKNKCKLIASTTLQKKFGPSVRVVSLKTIYHFLRKVSWDQISEGMRSNHNSQCYRVFKTSYDINAVLIFLRILYALYNCNYYLLLYFYNYQKAIFYLGYGAYELIFN